MLSHVLRELILPPSSLLALLVAGWLLHKKKSKWGGRLFVFTCIVFYLLSIPLVSLRLTSLCERRPALSLADIRAFAPGAVVVLGGGTNSRAAEYEGQTVPSSSGLKRLTYAAYLSRELNLPVITTGGTGTSREDSEGRAYARYLRENGVENVLVEDASLNTMENALFSKKVAENNGVERVVVVTDARHAARAEAAFLAARFEARVAPTGFRSRRHWERGVLMVIPSHEQFDASCSVLREFLASAYYRLRMPSLPKE